jgi:hypothetical protein
MSVSYNKRELKNKLLNIYENKENYTIISLYRELLIYNNKIQIYVSSDIYDNYINELYDIVDTYLYNTENIEDINNINDCLYGIIINL